MITSANYRWLAVTRGSCRIFVAIFTVQCLLCLHLRIIEPSANREKCEMGNNLMWQNKYRSFTRRAQSIGVVITPFNLTRDDEVQGSIGPSDEAGVSQSNGYHNDEWSGSFDIIWKHKIAWVSIQNYYLWIESNYRIGPKKLIRLFSRTNFDIRGKETNASVLSLLSWSN